MATVVVTNCGYRLITNCGYCGYSLITNCGYCCSHELWLPFNHELWLLWCASCCVCIFIKQLIFLFSSCDVIATTCFGHKTTHRLPNRYRRNAYANRYTSNSPINRISMITNNRNNTRIIRGLEYLHLSAVSRKRRRKGNPVPGSINMTGIRLRGFHLTQLFQ
jgi:hypothetical protein